MTTTDKTGAQVTVTEGHQTYAIAVEGKTVGHADYADRGEQRVFYHTVVDPEFGGRGLATILVEEALNGARDAGKRIVPVCSMVESVLKKHPEFDEVTDPVTAEVRGWAQTQPSS
ncbi:GNAT family N-acetyltransferase [Mycobacterium sp. pR1184]|uniref:GNAT family N-acetyltransferase n=1 Tax=Mycobacterium sp. pR1184 TaxID=3238981 RepID=UPI00351B987D